MTLDDLERQKGVLWIFLRFSANIGIHALYVARNTKIHALDMALGVIRPVPPSSLNETSLST